MLRQRAIPCRSSKTCAKRRPTRSLYNYSLISPAKSRPCESLSKSRSKSSSSSLPESLSPRYKDPDAGYQRRNNLFGETRRGRPCNKHLIGELVPKRCLCIPPSVAKTFSRQPDKFENSFIPVHKRTSRRVKDRYSFDLIDKTHRSMAAILKSKSLKGCSRDSIATQSTSYNRRRKRKDNIEFDKFYPNLNAHGKTNRISKSMQKNSPSPHNSHCGNNCDYLSWKTFYYNQSKLDAHQYDMRPTKYCLNGLDMSGIGRIWPGYENNNSNSGLPVTQIRKVAYKDNRRTNRQRDQRQETDTASQLSDTNSAEEESCSYRSVGRRHRNKRRDTNPKLEYDCSNGCTEEKTWDINGRLCKKTRTCQLCFNNSSYITSSQDSGSRRSRSMSEKRHHADQVKASPRGIRVGTFSSDEAVSDHGSQRRRSASPGTSKGGAGKAGAGGAKAAGNKRANVASSSPSLNKSASAKAASPASAKSDKKSPKQKGKKETKASIGGIVPLTPAEICERCKKYNMEQELGGCIPLDFSHVQQLEKLAEAIPEDSTKQLLTTVAAIIEEKVCKQMFRCMMPCSCSSCRDRPSVCESLEKFFGKDTKKSKDKGGKGGKGDKKKGGGKESPGKKKGGSDSPKKGKRKGAGKGREDEREKGSSGECCLVSQECCPMPSVSCCRRPSCCYRDPCCSHFEQSVPWNSSYKSCSNTRTGWWPTRSFIADRGCGAIRRSADMIGCSHRGSGDLLAGSIKGSADILSGSASKRSSVDKTQTDMTNNKNSAREDKTINKSGGPLTDIDAVMIKDDPLNLNRSDNKGTWDVRKPCYSSRWISPSCMTNSVDVSLTSSRGSLATKTMSDLMRRYGTDLKTPCPHDERVPGCRNLNHFRSHTSRSDLCFINDRCSTTPRWNVTSNRPIDGDNQTQEGAVKGNEGDSHPTDNFAGDDSGKAIDRIGARGDRQSPSRPRSQQPSPTTEAVGELEARTKALLAEVKLGQIGSLDTSKVGQFFLGFSPIKPPDVNMAYSVTGVKEVDPQQRAFGEDAGKDKSPSKLGIKDPDKQWWHELPKTPSVALANAVVLKKYDSKSSMPVCVKPIRSKSVKAASKDTQDSSGEVGARGRGGGGGGGSEADVHLMEGKPPSGNRRSRSEPRLTHRKSCPRTPKSGRQVTPDRQTEAARRTGSYTICKGRTGKQAEKEKHKKVLWKY